MATTDAELLKPELVFFDIEAKDAFELFDQLETRLSSLGYIKDTWKDAISTREKNYPTGLAFLQVRSQFHTPILSTLRSLTLQS